MGGLAVKLLLVEVSVYGSLSVLCPYTHTHTHTHTQPPAAALT